MPWFSFHGGHSGEFCRHARGRLDEVVAAAEAAGFSHYGLSEHAPRVRRRDRYPDELDLEPADLVSLFEAYLGRAHALRATCRLELLVGVESEVVPEDGWLELMVALRDRPEVDYVVGSVHHVAGVPIDSSLELWRRAADQVGGELALERAYFELVAQMIAALSPQVVAHLDLIRKFQGPGDGLAKRQASAIDDALEAARAVGAVLDVNSTPVRRGFGPVYPGPQILRRAAEVGVPVTLGDDSHGPDEVGGALEASLAAAARAGYRAVHCLVPTVDGTAWSAVPLEELRPGLP